MPYEIGSIVLAAIILIISFRVTTHRNISTEYYRLTKELDDRVNRIIEQYDGNLQDALEAESDNLTSYEEAKLIEEIAKIYRSNKHKPK